jgi:hypothetical protein
MIVVVKSKKNITVNVISRTDPFKQFNNPLYLLFFYFSFIEKQINITFFLILTMQKMKFLKIQIIFKLK